MTPTEQWIFQLALVYAVPSFLAGVGATLFFIKRRDIVRTAAAFLSPDLTFEKRELASSSPASESRSALPARFILEK